MEEVIKDKSPKPPGLLPKNLQAFVLVGLALLMVLIMAVTGHRRPVTPTAGAQSALPDPLPVNSDKVMDSRKELSKHKENRPRRPKQRCWNSRDDSRHSRFKHRRMEFP